MEAALEQKPEAAPVSSPDTPAPADEFTDLLAEFDRATAASEPTPEPAVDAPQPNRDAELDKFLAELDTSRDSAHINNLESQLSSMRLAEEARLALADFEGWSAKLQAELGPNVDEKFARTNLIAMAAQDRSLEKAWAYRHITPEQRRAADLEFQQLEALHWKVQQAPDDPRKAQALAQMERRGQELGLMMNAHKILNNAWRDVLKLAEKVKPPVDELATADREAVAFSIREGGSGRGMLPEPPVQLGNLSDNEFRKHLREKYGIAGF
jgi:hypothetical protein